jgi:hypothetical protein
MTTETRQIPRNVLKCRKAATVSWSRSEAESADWKGLARSGEGREVTQSPSHQTLRQGHGKLVAPHGTPPLGISGGTRKVIHGKLVAVRTVSWSRPRRKTADQATVSWSLKPIYIIPISFLPVVDRSLAVYKWPKHSVSQIVGQNSAGDLPRYEDRRLIRSRRAFGVELRPLGYHPT